MARQTQAAADLPVRSWSELNDLLRGADEAQCQKLLTAEQGRRPAPRKQFILRIHSRLNRARATRERRELMANLTK